MTDKASWIWRLHFVLVLLVSCWPNLGSDTSSNAKLREMFPDTYHKKVSTLEFNIPYYHKFEAMSLSFFMARVVRKGFAHKFQSRKCAKRTWGLFKIFCSKDHHEDLDDTQWLWLVVSVSFQLMACCWLSPS